MTYPWKKSTKRYGLMPAAGAICVMACACDSSSTSNGATASAGGSSAAIGSGGGSGTATHDTGAAGATVPGTNSGGTASTTTGASSDAVASDLLCGTRPSGTLRGTHVLRFESQSPRVVVQLVRRYVDAGAGESSVFDLDAFALVVDGGTHCVTERSRFAYTNSHHNWKDTAAVTVGGVHYQLSLEYRTENVPSTWAFTLEGVDSETGAVVLEPTLLVRSGCPTYCYECPPYSSVFITEAMASNTNSYVDEAGEAEPWIELFNGGTSPLNLNGWMVSNTFGKRDTFTLPAVTIPRHGCVLLVADGEPNEGPLHTTFRLSPEGGELVLTAPDGTTDGGFAFGPQTPNMSLIVDPQSGTFITTSAPTPEATNPNLL